MDRSFLIPKVNINLNIITPSLRTNTSEYLSLYIYNYYLSYSIEIEFSELKDAGGEISVTFDENGYVVSMSIFSDLVPKVTDKLLEIIFKPNITPSVYKELSESSFDELRDNIENQPYIKAKNIFKKLVKYGVSSNYDLTNYTSQMTYETFNKTISNILPTFVINSLFYGYLKEDNLTSINNKIKAYLKDSRIDTTKMVNYLHSQKQIAQPIIYRTVNDLKKEHNHLVYNYFQVGVRDYKTSLIMNIIEMIWGNMFYFQLRTVSQLGYIVSANKELQDNYMVNIPNLVFYIYSTG
jgi:secreted Zn-dependent insulinase-like peptidase